MMRLFLMIVMMVITVAPVKAQGLSVIRDTEIENILKKWSEPVLDTADLSNDQVRIVLINSPEINAFVAGGANIFIYAGLILKSEYPEELIGVIAHEVGHITGGHLIAGRNALEKASFQSILATVLGVGAAIVTGDSRAVGAIGAGGAGLAASGFLSHSRLQESAADQAGLKYLDGAQVNPAGIVSFLEKLESQELLPASQQSEYMRTHPLTRDRIDTMRIGAKESSFYGDLGESERQMEFDMMKAKLLAFIQPQNVTRYYQQNATDNASRYAYAIMHYQQKNYDAAVEIFDGLIADNPQNPYFIEMKAQTLRDSGQLEQAEIYYKQALTMVSNAPLIQVALAHVMIEQQKNTTEVEDLLLSSLQSDKRDSRAFRLLATIKGRQGLEADAQYYLAEEAVSQGQGKEAQRLLILATESGDLSQNLKIKAKDLEIFLNRLLEKGK